MRTGSALTAAIIVLLAGAVDAAWCQEKVLTGKTSVIVPIQIDRKAASFLAQDKAAALVPGATARDMAEADAYVKQQAGPTDDPTSGTTYYVAMTGLDANPGTQALPFRHIQHAVDVAQNGDTVRIMPGMNGIGYYFEQVVVNGKAIELRGDPANPSKVVIDGNNADGHVVSLFNAYNASGAVRLNGVTIQHGNGHAGPNSTIIGGGGVAVSGPNVVLENLIIKDNVGYYGGGLSASSAPGLIVRKSLIHNNTARFGAGMRVTLYAGDLGGPPVLIENVVVAGNGLLPDTCGSPLSHTSAGIEITGRGRVDIVNATMRGNQNILGKLGAGMVVQEGAVVNIINAILFQNATYLQGTSGTSAPTQIEVLGLNHTPGQGQASALSAYYSDVQGGLPGVAAAGTGNVISWVAGNINANPVFFNISSMYQIRAGSPCLAAGTAQASIPAMSWYGVALPARTVLAPSVDVSGNLRPGYNAQGQVDASPDMGAYEIGRIGDINHDGVVNAIDALFVAKHFTQMITLNPSQQVEADANNSGDINAIDALLIQKYFAQMISVLPYTGP